jgi:hypothetical protein
MKTLIFATALTLCATPLAFGEYTEHQWITENPKYRARGFMPDVAPHCCNQKDHCQPLPPGAVKSLPSGDFDVRGELILRGDAGVYPSEDGEYWYCKWAGEARYRCFFHPEAGS